MIKCTIFKSGSSVRCVVLFGFQAGDWENKKKMKYRVNTWIATWLFIVKYCGIVVAFLRNYIEIALTVMLVFRFYFSVSVSHCLHLSCAHTQSPMQSIRVCATVCTVSVQVQPIGSVTLCYCCCCFCSLFSIFYWAYSMLRFFFYFSLFLLGVCSIFFSLNFLLKHLIWASDQCENTNWSNWFKEYNSVYRTYTHSYDDERKREEKKHREATIRRICVVRWIDDERNRKRQTKTERERKKTAILFFVRIDDTSSDIEFHWIIIQSKW